MSSKGDFYTSLKEYIKIINEFRDDPDPSQRPELVINYDPKQKELYFGNPEECKYPQWDKPWGIHATGKNFPVMVARRFFEDEKYEVLVSGAQHNGYALIRYKKKRVEFPGFGIICNLFGKKCIDDVIREAEGIGIKGGDPDMFIYKKGTKEQYFVEVKEDDRLNENQKKLILILERYLCPVLIIRVKSLTP
jgi:hypothetical protein